MNHSQLRTLLTASAAALALAVAGAAARPQAAGRPAPPAGAHPAFGKIDYVREVKPLLTERCYACHGNGTRLGGLQIDSRAGILKGGQTGPAAIAGKSGASLLIKLVSGGDPARVMPARGKRLTPAEIALLRAWIDQGLPFGADATGPAWTPILAARTPPLPPARPAAGIVNPIDRLLQPYYTAHHVTPGPLVDDRTYMRRAYLDVIGLLPTAEQQHAFLSDRRPNRRERLARALLADDQDYAEHWITFWNDMLRNDYTGTGYIDGGRTQITDWLYGALANNMPYDRFVWQLVDPTPASDGFVKGIVWRGVVNASQTPQMQAAQNISQVFMGVNLKCASCHNSFISTWKLVDSYGMAGIYADHALETVRCDRPTGTIAPIKFLYPELGQIDANAPREKRMEQLALVLTSRANGRLARTLVNRLWGRLMGRCLVEPADDMDQRPWDPDLLDWLASDLQGHGYDVRRTLLEIVTSRAYQLAAAPQRSESATNFVFTGPVVKRMTAEQYCDAVSELTGVWETPAAAIRINKGQPLVPRGATLRFNSGVMRSGSANIDVDLTGAKALALVVTDAGDGANHDWADWCDPRLEGPQGTIKLTTLKWHGATTGYGAIQIGKSVVEKPLVLGDRTYADGIGTHANSIITYELPPGVTRFRATAGPDANGVKDGNGETSVVFCVVTGDRSLVDARSSMAVANPLMVALGRPNREQVVTERSTVATTLQALELTNGRTLDSRLEAGAARWCGGTHASSTDLVTRIYELALDRPPTPAELHDGAALVGTPAQPAGVQDLLWSLTMLPEFQLVY